MERELNNPFNSVNDALAGEPTKMDIQKMIKKRTEKIYNRLKAAAEKQIEELPDMAA